MSLADITEKARSCGVSLTLTAAGTGLSLWVDGDPPEEVVELLKAHKPDLVAHLQAERGRINHWIADQLTDWPPSHCLHCKKPTIVGQLWTTVSNSEVSARLHQGCHGAWLAQQEERARRAMGLK
jgi:hypothetical protein